MLMRKLGRTRLTLLLFHMRMRSPVATSKDPRPIRVPEHMERSRVCLAAIGRHSILMRDSTAFQKEGSARQAGL